MRPIIGLTHSVNLDEGSLHTPINYPSAIMEAGGTPLLLPVTTDETLLNAYLDVVDGVLFSGGDDIDPSTYGEDQAQGLGDVCPLRDRYEIPLCRLALQRRMPVLGICRGLQLVNVALGGTLYQDLPSQYSGCIRHGQKQRGKYASHRVTLQAGSKLHGLYGDTALVNSFHHQAAKDVAPSLTVTATGPDGVIEGLEMAEHPYFVAVQWHPEILVKNEENAVHKKLFRSFVDACRK